MAVLVYEEDGVLLGVEFDATLGETHIVSANVTSHPVEVGSAISDHIRPELDKVNIEGLVTNTPINSTAVAIALLQGTYTPDVKAVAGLRGTYAQSPSFQVARRAMLRGAQVTGGKMPPITPPGIAGLALGPSVARIQPTPIRTYPAQYGETRETYGKPLLTFPEQVDRVGEIFYILQRLCSKGIVVRLVTELRDYEDMAITNIECPREPMDALKFKMQLTSIRFVSTETTKVKIKKTAEKRAQKKTTEGAKGRDIKNLDQEADKKTIVKRVAQAAAGDES